MKNSSLTQFLKTRGLLLILLLAFVIRIGFFVSLQPWNKEVVDKAIIVSDGIGYHHLALSLLSKKSFEDFDAFRTPGYPLFVALMYGISAGSVWFVLLIQIFLNLISVLLVYKIALTLFSRKIALLSAFLFAIDIHQALFAVTLLTDTFFVFLFLASVLYLCKSIKENDFSSLCLSALFLGISTLVRPISFLFPLVAVIFILVLCRLTLKMRLVYALVFGLIFIIAISPWLIHNYAKYGEAKLSSISGYNLLFYNVAYTEVYKTGKTIEQVTGEFNALAIKQGIDTTDRYLFKNSTIYADIAHRYIKDNFILYCKRHLMGIVNMYAGIGIPHITAIFHLESKPVIADQFAGPGIFTRIRNYFSSRTAAEILITYGLGLYLFIIYLFSLSGIFILVKRRERFVFLFILIILYFSALTGVVGSVRYRIPIMPFFDILCAVGLLPLYEKIMDKFSRVKI